MGTFIRLINYNTAEEKKSAFHNKNNWFDFSQNEINKIPGNPIVYWLNKKIILLFSENISITKKITAKQGVATADNDRFLKFWHEIYFSKIGIKKSTYLKSKWYPYNKGGSFRKWYGNIEYVIT